VHIERLYLYFVIRKKKEEEKKSERPSPIWPLGMKTDQIRTDITDIIFVFIFLVGFGFKYG